MLLVAAQSWGQEPDVCSYVPSKNQLSALSLSGDYRQFEDRYLDDQDNIRIGHFTLQGFSWMDEPEWGYRVDGSARLELAERIKLEYTINSAADLRRYISDTAFFFGGADTVGLPGQEGLTVNVLGGAGWGRFRDVTPLAKALKIARTLQSEGILAQMPTAEVIQGLAQLIGRRAELGVSNTLEEIEKLLGARLGVGGVLALQEILDSAGTRFCGWDVSLALGYELIDPSGLSNAILRAEANYAVAVDPDSQLIANARWRAPFPLAGESLLQASLGYHRALSARADLTAAYTLTALQQDELSTWTQGLDLAMHFQVHTALSVMFQAQAKWGTGFEETEWGFSVGFQYDLF